MSVSIFKRNIYLIHGDVNANDGVSYVNKYGMKMKCLEDWLLQHIQEIFLFTHYFKKWWFLTVLLIRSTYLKKRWAVSCLCFAPHQAVCPLSHWPCMTRHVQCPRSISRPTHTRRRLPHVDRKTSTRSRPPSPGSLLSALVSRTALTKSWSEKIW